MSSRVLPDPRTSFIDSKQLVVFLIVPAVYQLARGNRALTVFNVIITVGAASAILGIVQYGVLNYDHLGQRPQGALGHYMTYSGLLVLVICRCRRPTAVRYASLRLGRDRHAVARRSHRA